MVGSILFVYMTHHLHILLLSCIMYRHAYLIGCVNNVFIYYALLYLLFRHVVLFCFITIYLIAMFPYIYHYGDNINNIHEKCFSYINNVIGIYKH